MWHLSAARLLQPYAATLVKKRVCGQVGCLGQDVNKASGLAIAHSCWRELLEESTAEFVVVKRATVPGSVNNLLH